MKLRPAIRILVALLPLASGWALFQHYAFLCPLHKWGNGADVYSGLAAIAGAAVAFLFPKNRSGYLWFGLLLLVSIAVSFLCFHGYNNHVQYPATVENKSFYKDVAMRWYCAFYFLYGWSLTLFGRTIVKAWPLTSPSQSAAPVPTVCSESLEPVTSDTSQHILMLLHGIRTDAAWQDMVRTSLQRIHDVTAIPVKYGYFNAIRFWLPIGRLGAINRVRREIGEVSKKYPNAKVSVIAHSFGTYIIGELLKEMPDLKLKRLILVASVLPRDYNWSLVGNKIDDTVINECSRRDIWPVLGASLSWGYGDSGVCGFGTVKCRDRFHQGLGHSDYFSETFVNDFWVPYIAQGTSVEASDPRSGSWFRSILGTIPLKYVLVILLIALPILLIAVLHYF